jgi:hypothetical protein
MVPILNLWLPIVVSAVFVFIASSIVHMLMPYHRSDFKQMSSEAEVMEALRKFGIKPGDYLVPHPGGPQGMKSPAYQEKISRGPIFTATFMPTGPIAMGKQLMQWFLFCVVVSVFAAYVTGRAAGPGTEYLVIFRFSGTTAFLAYTVAQWSDTIWYKRSWATTAKNTVDGLIYSLLTAGAFGWLWPTE